MSSSLLFNTNSKLLAVLLFAGIIIFYFGGLSVTRWKKKRNPTYESNGMGAFEGAMLGLISLLLAFTFNKAASYYDSRREILVHETNCIGTVLMRADLYPDSVRTEIRNDLKEYITSRIHYYEVGDDEKKIKTELLNANTIAEKIWNVLQLFHKQTRRL